jgi:lysophospholipase L1-like esterase
MSRTALYFASGESLYLGATLLLLAAVAPTFLKRAWMLRIRNVVAWVALILMVIACPPFSIIVDLIFVGAFVLWIITSNQATPSPTSARLQRGSTVVLVALLLVLTAIEFSHRRMPKIGGSASDHLVVIGDSISSGIDPRLQAWPLVLQQTCGVEIRNLARPGAQVSEGLLIAKGLTDNDHLVLIEIGGNDLLMGVSSDEYGKALDALLSKVVAPNRTVLMFELPLLPNKIAYGQIQRRLSAKYHVFLIPKRFFAQVIGDANATTDGLHLSASGAHRMARLVAQVLSPLLKSCQSRSNLRGLLTMTVVNAL